MLDRRNAIDAAVDARRDKLNPQNDTRYYTDSPSHTSHYIGAW
jgi:hypothetical protein